MAVLCPKIKKSIKSVTQKCNKRRNLNGFAVFVFLDIVHNFTETKMMQKGAVNNVLQHINAYVSKNRSNSTRDNALS